MAIRGREDRPLPSGTTELRTRFPCSDELVRQGRVLQATGFFSGLSHRTPPGASAVRIQTGAIASARPSCRARCGAMIPNATRARRRGSESGDCSDAAIAAAIHGRTPTPSRGRHRSARRQCSRAGVAGARSATATARRADLRSHVRATAVVRLRACLGAVRGRDRRRAEGPAPSGRGSVHRVPLRQLSPHLRVRPVWKYSHRAAAVSVRPVLCSPASQVHPKPTARVLPSSDTVVRTVGVGATRRASRKCPDAENSCQPCST